MKLNSKTIKLCLTGMMGALVFASTFLNIQIPLPGTQTMIHLGNVMCILSAIVLGPIYGGCAAGIGSFLFDLLNPLYISDCAFTLIFKFILAFVCGKIAYAKNKNALAPKRNIIASICGMFSYIILHLSKTFVHELLLGVSMEATFILVGQKAIVSSINAIIAVIIAMPLGTQINYLLKKSILKKDK